MRLLIILLLLPLFSFSQEENKYIREGNKLYNAKKYEEAERSYSQALSKNNKNFKSAFNLADAYYKQENYDEAASRFEALTNSAPDKTLKSKAFHNLGNSLLKKQKYEESINAYKNALKNNPADEDSRYNLSYAQQMLKQQQQQQQQQEQKQDKKEEEKKEEEKKEEKQDQQQQPKKDEISKQEAQRLLDAMNNEEKNVQEKLNKKKVGVKVNIEKDW